MVRLCFGYVSVMFRLLLLLLLLLPVPVPVPADAIFSLLTVKIEEGVGMTGHSAGRKLSGIGAIIRRCRRM